MRVTLFGRAVALGAGALAAGFVGSASGLATMSATAASTADARAPALSQLPPRLVAKLKEVSHLKRVSALAEWDQLVMMPDVEPAHEERGEQLAALAAVVHERETDAGLGELIAQAEAAGPTDPVASAVLREARRQFDRNTKIPAALAEKKAKLASAAYAAWAKARADNDFAAFKPVLADCFETAAEVARCTRRDEKELYDVCMAEFEPGMTAARLQELFSATRDALRPLIAAVLASKHAPAAEPLGAAKPFAITAQEALNKEIVRELGFSHGRVDVSVHPFTTSFSPADVRITSRFREDEWYQGLAGSVHETGHALYESALGRSGLPIDEALSMGVHESQSLFWERHIGLSSPFWQYAAPKLSKHLGVGSDANALYGATNRVRPSLIRVEADELTYPMHVIMRFEIERALLHGDMSVDELPAVWSAKMRELLGVEVPDDRRGCLQDVHWSGLAIGYFPTYLLGAMMAAQLAHHIRRDMPDIDAKVAAGDFAPIRAWLGEKVHKRGSVPTSMDALLTEAVGEPLKPQYLIEYLTDKYTRLYQIERPK